MGSRVERYSNENSYNNKNASKSRVVKNRYLHDDLNNKIGYEEIIEFNTQTKVDLSSLVNSKKSREEYHQTKDYQDFMGPRVEKEKKVVEPEKEKVFDINAILEEARKNREETDELEKKRNLKNEDYNVLSNLNKKYVEQKIEKKEDYEGLEELIDTITSKTLSADIEQEIDDDKDLLGDLVATSVDLQVNAPEIDDDDTEVKESFIDKSFYTRSMDLSEADFDFGDEINGSRGKRVVLIIIVIVVLLVIIGVVGYFVLDKLGIDILSNIFK